MPKEGETGARLTSGELVITFVWRGDRFTEAISNGLAKLTAAPSDNLETPVYQEVHQQGDVVFASGMSGDRHWSASIEPTDGGFAFDVACRLKSDASALGSAYSRSGVDGLHVLGQSSDTAEPPRLNTAGATLHVVAETPASPPATVRYRYAIVGGQPPSI